MPLCMHMTTPCAMCALLGTGLRAGTYVLSRGQVLKMVLTAPLGSGGDVPVPRDCSRASESHM